MDLLILVIIFLFSFTFIIRKVVLNSKTQNPHPPPPGPWSLPLIGCIHHLFTSLPHRALHRLAQHHGPLMLVKLGQVDHVIVSSPEVAKEILTTHDLNFCDRPELLVPYITSYGYTDIAFAPYGDYWRQLRKICTVELLSAKRVGTFRSLREEEISNLVRGIADASPAAVNLSRKLTNLSNSITGRAVFGKRCEHQERFISVLNYVLSLASGFSIADLFPSLKSIDVVNRFRAERGHRLVDEILGQIIKEHEAARANRSKELDGIVEEGEDLVDVLLRIRDDGELGFSITTNNLKAVILDMFSAGTESSSTVINWTMSELMKNPRCMMKAQTEVRRVIGKRGEIEEKDVGELRYLKMVIKEVMRLRPPTPLLMPRKCVKTCQVNGFHIEAGCRVIVNAWALGRDPKYWEDAESFKPERFDGSSIDFKGVNFEFIPFGAGRRICPGITFGMASVDLTLANLLFHFNWELSGGTKAEDLDMTESFGITARRKSDLLLVATPYVAI